MINRRPKVHEILSVVFLLALGSIAVKVLFSTIFPSQEEHPVKATRQWQWIDPDTGDSHTITVETIRGVPGAGETVASTETVAEWKARHLARVAVAKQAFPPVSG